MDGLSKIFWTVLALESAWVLMIIYSLFLGTPKGGFGSNEGLLALLMFGGVALAPGFVASLYFGGIALWFHFRYSVFALAALAPPLLFILPSLGDSR